MAVIPFKAPNTTGQDGGSTILDRIGDMIEDSIRSLLNAVTNDKLVKATLDNTKDWPVTHGLGRAPKTWEVVDQDANATVWRSKAANARASTVILLRASASVNVLLRFM